MRSLFLKVFLWFWLAMALVIGALVLTTELTRRRQHFPLSTGMDRAMGGFARLAAVTFEREGREGLVKLFGDFGDTPDVVFYLFDERGAEVTGRDAPPAIREAARRALSSGVVVRGAPGAFVAHPTTTDGGRRFVLVDSMTPRGLLSDHPWAQALRVLAVLLTAGLLCYGLARYITSPVIKLREATRLVAAGDFSARVTPTLSRRRDELADMGRDFDAMAARVEALLSAQSRLVRDISHELRSPLARLGVALDLARKRAGAAAAGDLARIEREAGRLNEMIGQLLTLSRWETGADGARGGPFDLSALVREVAEDADFEARSQGRTVRVVECDECEVAGTPSLLHSAVENVVRNAVRHAPPGTEVGVSLRRARAAGGEAAAVISVRDEGAGVPEESLSDIFRPFYRVDDSRTRETGGAGLGLAIAERAVRLHGGDVAAKNLAGGGFAVEIRLPVAQSHAPRHMTS
ncbi:MAG TPA: ATP-binding protein [Pyrinomonadaceae bacterium]|jgi:two-component system sensor histidine kinase CpxA|nr:ATP-binding protein [Pyrinomonadaceae bacterium]